MSSKYSFFNNVFILSDLQIHQHNSGILYGSLDSPAKRFDKKIDKQAHRHGQRRFIHIHVLT